MADALTHPPITGRAPDGPDLGHLDLVLLGVVGSTAYGLAHAGSDKDRIGVYLAPTRATLGLSAREVTGGTHVTKDPAPDSAVHELAKFCSLALKANPTVLELLWLSEYEVATDIGALLIESRGAFLSGPAVAGSYGGYAKQQATRLMNRATAGEEGFGGGMTGRTEKHGRHCLRLLRQGQELLATGDLTLNVSHMRDELFDAGRLAASDPLAFYAMFERELEQMDETTSVLPDAPDRARIEELVVSARLAHLE